MVSVGFDKKRDMRICIFGSASDDIDRVYIEAGEKLGEMLGK